MTTTRQPSRRDALKAGGALAVAAASAVAGIARKAEAAENKAPRWAMILDLRRCTGVRACVSACKAEFDVPLGSWRTVVREVEIGAYPGVTKEFLPRLCNHCEGSAQDGVPPCVKICPENASGERMKFKTGDGGTIRYKTGATYKRPDGMIMFDNSLCIGCGKCIDGCPYGARSFNLRLKSGKDPQKNAIVKCSFCQHRVDNGVAPACVNTCPTGARIFGDLNDPGSEVARLAKQFKLVEHSAETTLLAEEGTVPQVFHIDPGKALSKYKITKDNKADEFRADYI